MNHLYGIIAGLTIILGSGITCITNKGAKVSTNPAIYTEVCDGEVVVVEEVRKTLYVFPDRDEEDLANKEVVTEDDISYLIDHYLQFYPDSALRGCAMAFIDASNETGLDPLFLLSLCGIESAWGSNKRHKDMNNPYSFGMYGDGVHNGYSLGESFYDGIVNGARYIYQHYYQAGQTSLYLMNHVKDHSYCAGDRDWEYQIEAEMNYLRCLLDNR